MENTDYAAIAARNVIKEYAIPGGESRLALAGVDLEITRGDFVAVMGPSGSGKSTLLHALSGMDRITSGSVLFGGRELASLDEDAVARVRLNDMGFVFQSMNLLRNLCVRDNIVAPGYLARRKSRAAIDERADFLMERMGISDLGGRSITQVSGGQLQRAAICRALINEPSVLFADEPTGALDSRSASEVLDIFGMLYGEGTTIVLVTHDVKVAARAARVLFMSDGTIADESRAESPHSSSAAAVREQMLSRKLFACVGADSSRV